MYETFGVQNHQPIEAFEIIQNGKIPVAKSTLYLADDSNTAWALIEEIVNWTNQQFAKNNGAFGDIPICALQLYCVSHYYHFVRDIGHEGFVKATYNKSDEIWPYVLAGFINMNAIDYIDIFQQMVDWTARNIDGNINIENSMAFYDELDSLDNKFEALNTITPFSNIATKWVKTWDNVEIIPDNLSDFAKDVVNAA